MTAIGDKVCMMVNCDYCPFNKKEFLRVCTSFKLNEPIRKGYHNFYYDFSEKQRYIISRYLEKDYEIILKEKKNERCKN